MRLPSVLNWGMLCLNGFLFMFLLLVLLQSLPPRACKLPSGIAAQGMEVYYKKDPFVLLTSKDFPRTESFMLDWQDQPLSMSVLDVDKIDGAATKSASMQLTPDFSLSCDYSLSENGAQVHQLMLCHRNKGLLEGLSDLNVDGVFDVRNTRDDKRHISHLYVWYNEDWHEVMGGDKDPKQDLFHKQLKEGKRVLFDKQSGKWILDELKEEKETHRKKNENGSELNGT